MRARALLLAALLAPSTAAAGVRMAVVVGNNTGSPGRPKLWFAERDAERFARSLVELGDFKADAVMVLRGTNADALREVLAAAERRLGEAKAAGQATLLVFYFSGHAAAGGLELGPDQFRFDELRNILQNSSADARVGIVDACESGALTQVKGARAAPELDFPLPADGAKGTAYIASTAIGEAAQESAALGGSFFTFHLDAAMRGAADADGDGQVTLAEAFRYTSGRTVIGTAGTDLGAQHPTYDIRMSGRGDVVLTNLRRADTRLRLPGGDQANFLISNQGGLVAAAPGGAVVALPAGRYRVERREGAERSETSVLLEKGETRTAESFVATDAVALRAKGGELPAWGVFAAVGAGPMPLSNMGLAPAWRVGLRHDIGLFRAGAAFDYLQAQATDGGLSYHYASVGGSLQLTAALLDRFVRVDGGVRGGFAWNTQTVDGGGRASGGAASAGAVLSAEVPLGSLRIGLAGEGGARWLKVNGALESRRNLMASAFVAFTL